MRILVTFAVDAEFAPWRRMRKFRRTRWGTRPAYVTEIDGVEIGVVLTGIGPERARLAAFEVMMAEPVDVCVSAGLAGALQAEHLPLEIVAARRVWSEEESRAVRSDELLLRWAGEWGAKTVERFFTSDHLVLTAREKARLGELGDAVEMESFEVLKEARAWNVRAAAVRAISDAAGEDLPLDFTRVVGARGEVRIFHLLKEIARRPGSWPALVRFGHQSRRAATSLALFLDRYVTHLANRGAELHSEVAEEISCT